MKLILYMAVSSILFYFVINPKEKPPVLNGYIALFIIFIGMFTIIRWQIIFVVAVGGYILPIALWGLKIGKTQEAQEKQRQELLKKKNNGESGGIPPSELTGERFHIFEEEAKKRGEVLYLHRGEFYSATPEELDLMKKIRDLEKTNPVKAVTLKGELLKKRQERKERNNNSEIKTTETREAKE